MGAMKLNILVDFTSELGKTSRLVKVLRENGFSPQLLSYDVVRLKTEFHLAENNVIRNILNGVHNLGELVASWKGFWEAVCLEAWIEEKGGKVQNTLLEVDDICVYVRRGKGVILTKKLVWTKPCKWMGGGPIPESITRKCLDSVEGLNAAFNHIARFITILLATVQK